MHECVAGSGQVGKGVRSRENSRGSLRGGVASQPLAVSSRFWRPENILEEEPGPAECAAAEESAVNNNNITNISSSAPGSPTGDTWDAKEVSTGADNVEKAYKSLPGAGMLHLDKVESKRSQKRSHGGGHTEVRCSVLYKRVLCCGLLTLDHAKAFIGT